MFMNVAAERAPACASLRLILFAPPRKSLQRLRLRRWKPAETGFARHGCVPGFPELLLKKAAKARAKGASRWFVSARATQCDSKANTPR
jgi:hypothetical protein